MKIDKADVEYEKTIRLTNALYILQKDIERTTGKYEPPWCGFDGSFLVIFFVVVWNFEYHDYTTQN